MSIRSSPPFRLERKEVPMTLFEVFEEGVMHDVEFMTADEKRKVLKQWELFLQSGLKKEKFTKSLYTHLIMHCSFIAHYSIHGFYATYFENGDAIMIFLSQFDGRNGIPKSVEYGMHYWYTREEHHDINSEMVRIASKYVPVLLQQAQNRQKEADIAQARALLAKHRITLNEEE